MLVEECDRILAGQWVDDETQLALLAELFASSREGHLCIPARGELPSSVPIMDRGGLRYLLRNWMALSTVVEQWERVGGQQVAPLTLSSDESLLPAQQAAVDSVLLNPFTIIVGGPGTGKTYTARKLVEGLQREHPDLHIALAAPTGKAVSNLKGNLEVAGEIKTLHALLHRKQRISADVILVDESSMIDVELMGRLFSGIKRGGRLVLVGDPDQLPPVEAGSLFADLVKQEGCVVRLETCLRAEKDSLITLAEEIRTGIAAPPLSLLSDPNAIARKFIRAWDADLTESNDPYELLELSKRSRMLTLLRKGRYGVERMNTLCRERSKMSATPIMITANDYRQNLFNGEMGIVLDGQAFFPGRSLPCSLLPPHEVAYCLSVHKSQGSEFDVVTLLLPEGSERFGRQGLYTGVTRAKKHVEILEEQGEFARCLAHRLFRNSGLSQIASMRANDGNEG